jgi:hypothetical protein
MNYQELKEAYEQAEMPFDEHFQRASMLVPYNTPKAEANNMIISILSYWLERYAESKAKTKKGGILRRIAHMLSGIIPSIVFNAKKSKSK